MTSIEALNKIVDGYNEITTGINGLGEVIVDNPLIRCYNEELDIIQKDLTRFEIIEKEIKFLADKKMEIFKFPNGRTILGFDISESEMVGYQRMFDNVLKKLIKEIWNNE